MIATDESELNRYVTGFWKWILGAITITGLLLAINHIFNLRFGLDISILEPSYLYMLVGFFLATSFIVFPANAKAARKVQWYDMVLAVVAFSIMSYLAFKAPDIVPEGWEITAPNWAVGLGVVVILLFLEAVRRIVGWIFVAIVLILAAYPLYAGADFLPVKGFNLPWQDAVRFHMFSTASIMGVTTQVVGNLLIGFSVFGITLFHTGAGAFFANICIALMGHVRGGTGKVAIVSSGLLGSMGGHGVSNVLSTGTMTIPAMKRTGFPATVAAAIESNAAAHGAVTPPVMGATAFIMAALLGVPYTQVALAAAIPAILFYYGMFCQLDGYAGKHRLKGLPREELPSVTATLKDGWIFIAGLAILIGCLLFLKQEAPAPWYATAALLLATNLRKRWTREKWVDYLVAINRLLSALVPLLGTIGMIVGGLHITGTLGSLTSDMVHFAGNNVALLLVFGALASFILGTALPGSVSYVLLAIMMAPVLVGQGLNVLAVHLFLLYWASLADVTPPTAISVVAAAGVANAPVMESMWEATRIAAVKYVEPFMFVIAPARILQTDNPVEFIVIFVTALIGIAVVGYSLQGYLLGVGSLRPSPLIRAMRLALVVGGFCIAYPDTLVSGVGLAIVVPVYGFLVLARQLGWMNILEADAEPVAISAVDALAAEPAPATTMATDASTAS